MDKRFGRPPGDATDVERWTGSEWVPDDGFYGQAFIGRGYNNTPFAWAVDAREYPHPIEDMAMRRCCDKWGCANGRELVVSPTAWEKVMAS